MSKMICPECGVEMNHHADKLDYAATVTAAPDVDLGGVLSEVHTCPSCGRTHVRHIAP